MNGNHTAFFNLAFDGQCAPSAIRSSPHQHAMHLEDYTADNICQAMRLPGFIEAHWAQSDVPTLRVILTPSFTPELCMTFSRTDDSASVSVIALAEQFWAHRSEAYLPRDCEEARLPLGAFDDAVRLFELAHS